MIDRSQVVFPFRPPILLGAAGISGTIFALPIAAWLICWLLGLVGFTVCWLVYLILLILLYGLVIGGALVVFGILAAAAGQAGKTGSKDEGAAGCLAIVGLLLGIGILSQGLPWATKALESPHATWTSAADNSLAGGREMAGFFLDDIFLGTGVYWWSWTVLGVAVTQAAGAGLALGALSLEPLAKRSLLRSYNRCPKCAHRWPTYRCPNPRCGRFVADLGPSPYGIWRAACGACGTPLPTTDLAGRLRLEKVCGNPDCQHDLAGAALGRAAEYHLALAGAQSGGKTTLLFAALWQLLEEFAPRHGWTAALQDPRQVAEYAAVVAGFKSGQATAKTISTARSLAFNVAVGLPGQRPALLYLYDAAGEDFEAGDLGAGGTPGLSDQDYHGYADGLILVVDPFAEEQLRADEPPRPQDEAARYDLAYLIGRLLPFWERSQRVGVDRRLTTPLAVVVTKSDACSLEGRLARWPAPPPSAPLAAAVAAAEAASGEVRQFLLDAGAGAAVRLLEDHFVTVRYFGVSALGRRRDPTDRTPFAPRRVLAPLLWLGHRSGALRDRPTAFHALANLGSYLGRCLHGFEGPAAQGAAWGLTVGGGAAGVYGVWWLAGPAAAVALGLLLAAAPWLVARYRAVGWADLAAGRARGQRLRAWLGPALARRAGRRAWWQALAVVGLVTTVILSLAFLWWPLGVLAAGAVAGLAWATQGE